MNLLGWSVLFFKIGGIGTFVFGMCFQVPFLKRWKEYCLSIAAVFALWTVACAIAIVFELAVIGAIAVSR